MQLRAYYLLLPGLAVVFLLTLISQGLNELAWLASLGLGNLTLAILLGMLLGSIWPLAQTNKLVQGITFSKGALLRWGIVLYGFRLSLQQVEALGSVAIVSDLFILISTFVLCYLVGTKFLKMSSNSAALIGAGSSICGAAAVVATGASIKANEQDQASAVSTVVIFGTLSLLLYPWLFHQQIWPITEQAFAVYIGSSIHEVAQVVAAGSAISPEVAETAIATKMLRVMMLGPFLFLLLRSVSFGGDEASNTIERLPVPWFAFIFIGVVVFNSFHLLPENAINLIITLDDFILAMAMLALGLSSSIAAIRAAGVKPIVLGALAWCWLIIAGGFMQVWLS